MTLRIDAAQLREPERTDEGYIRAEGVIAAPGVLEYRTKSGETVRELVPPQTLRDPEFLQSLEDKPLTLEHPDEPVEPENVQELAVGNADDVEWHDALKRPDGSKGPGVKGTIIIRDADAIEAYEDGTLELSPAYEVELEQRSGQSPYGAYDRVQAKRRAGNHVALTDQGRAGTTAMLRADSDATLIRVDASVEDIDTTPPETAREAARKALRWREEHPDEIAGGTRVGWERANQLDNGEELSAETVMRMHSFFSRHMAQGNHKLDDKYEGEPWKDAGYVAHLLWGGDTGASWAERKAEQIQEAREDAMLRRHDADLSVGDYARWNTSGRDARGKIESIERNGTIDVPGADVTVEGTDDDPAALLTVYQPADDGDAWQRTETKVAHKLSTLNKIEPLDVKPRTDTREDAMPEKVRLDSELSVTVPEDQAEKIRRWKEDQEEQQVELSDQVQSAQEEIQAFKQEIEELKSERDELQKQIDTKKKQLQMLAEKMGLSEMMGSSGESDQPRQPEGAGSGQQPRPSGDGMSEEKVDSLVAERIQEMAEARMDALEAAEMLGLDVEGGESTDSIRERVVHAFYNDVDASRMDSDYVEARFDVAVDELESRAEEREESYESANTRTDSDDGPRDPEAAYHEQVYG
ncbi:MAG: DUF2213 domain-containing protein [Bradymonadaceae bacterium]